MWAITWQTDKRLAVTNIVLQIVQSLLPVVSLYFIKALIESVTDGNSSFDRTLLLILLFSGVQLLTAMAAQYSGYISKIHLQKVTDHLSEKVLHKAIEVDYEYYENPSYHDTLHLAQQQAIYKASALLSSFNSIILNSTSLLFLTGFFVALHSSFAILFLCMSVPLAIVKWYQGQSIARQERQLAPTEREAGYIHNMLTATTSAKEVRTLGFGAFYIGKFRKIRAYIFGERRSLAAKHARHSLLAESAEIIVMSILIILLARSAWEKTITLGTFVVYLQGFQRLQSASRNFLQSVVQVLQQNIFLRDLFAFLNIPNVATSTAEQAFPEINKGLFVDKVSFTYPDANKYALKDVTLECRPGSIIAIVGENGSGKSTLVKLLARLYKLQTGSVYIDNAELQSISTSSYNANCNFIFQDFEKYFLTVEENIKLGSNEQQNDIGRLENAATLSGAHHFIKRLSKEYKTRLGRYFESSEQLSGGQWQKLVLSRIFYKDAQLIVIDEPTSALDPISEAEVFKNIKDTLGNKMLILISHRLYNLKFADMIYVMHEGAIIEQGSFEELKAVNGKFAEMFEAQRL
ncbi:MAG: ABC transporter ATP-binding protein [Bacteroidetes bacterium]|nr:ABC transporter ATP-binding protein [Bacteroidota bacterium]